MPKKPNLAAALHEASGKKQSFEIPKSSPKIPTVLDCKISSRYGKKVVAGYFDPAVTRQLKILAMDNNSSIQSLLSEALNDLFEKHGLKQIA